MLSTGLIKNPVAWLVLALVALLIGSATIAYFKWGEARVLTEVNKSLVQRAEKAESEVREVRAQMKAQAKVDAAQSTVRASSKQKMQEVYTDVRTEAEYEAESKAESGPSASISDDAVARLRRLSAAGNASISSASELP